MGFAAPPILQGHRLTAPSSPVVCFLAVRGFGSRAAVATPCAARAGAGNAPIGPHAGVDSRSKRGAIPAFDTRDRATHTRFGNSPLYRGGLVLTSRYKDFGGISGLRLDDKDEGFPSPSATGQLVHRQDLL